MSGHQTSQAKSREEQDVQSSLQQTGPWYFNPQHIIDSSQFQYTIGQPFCPPQPVQNATAPPQPSTDLASYMGWNSPASFPGFSGIPPSEAAPPPINWAYSIPPNMDGTSSNGTPFGSHFTQPEQNAQYQFTGRSSYTSPLSCQSFATPSSVSSMQPHGQGQQSFETPGSRIDPNFRFDFSTPSHGSSHHQSHHSTTVTPAISLDSNRSALSGDFGGGNLDDIAGPGGTQAMADFINSASNDGMEDWFATGLAFSTPSPLTLPGANDANYQPSHFSQDTIHASYPAPGPSDASDAIAQAQGYEAGASGFSAGVTTVDREALRNGRTRPHLSPYRPAQGPYLPANSFLYATLPQNQPHLASLQSSSSSSPSREQRVEEVEKPSQTTSPAYNESEAIKHVLQAMLETAVANRENDAPLHIYVPSAPEYDSRTQQTRFPTREQQQQQPEVLLWPYPRNAPERFLATEPDEMVVEEGEIGSKEEEVRSSSKRKRKGSFQSLLTMDDGSLFKNHFRIEGGRVFHTSETSKWVLPSDMTEGYRLIIQHFALYQHIGSNWIPELRLNEMNTDRNRPSGPLAILECGAGTGNWALEMSEEFKDATVVGVDMVPIQSELTTINCTFECDDLNRGMDPYGPGKWDLVHARFIGMGINDYPQFIKEAADVLRPNGILCVVEYSYMESWSQAGTAMSQFQSMIDRMMRRNENDNILGPRLKTLLNDSGKYYNVGEKIEHLRVGAWDPDPRLKSVGESMRQSILIVFEAHRPAFLQDPSYTEESFNKLLKNAKEELADPTFNYVLPIHYAWGWKKPT